MATELATRPVAEHSGATQIMEPAEWAMIKEQAHSLELAGDKTQILPKGITNRYQIAAIIMKGRELGFAPMYSLEQIGLVNGKPVVQGQALTAIIQARVGAGAIKLIESTDQRAVFEFQRPGAEPMRLEWTVEMAKKADLANKDVWKKYGRTMLRWRCIAEGARIYFADIVAGLYLPDEMGLPVTVTADGNVVAEQLSDGSARPVDVETGEIIEPSTEPEADTSALIPPPPESAKKTGVVAEKDEAAAITREYASATQMKVETVQRWARQKLEAADVKLPPAAEWTAKDYGVYTEYVKQALVAFLAQKAAREDADKPTEQRELETVQL